MTHYTNDNGNSTMYFFAYDCIKFAVFPPDKIRIPQIKQGKAGLLSNFEFWLQIEMLIFWVFLAIELHAQDIILYADNIYFGESYNNFLMHGT